MTVANGTHWYAVQTHVRQEFAALSHLRRQNYQAYLPRYMKKIRHARKTEMAARPYFPGYLFVNLNLSITGWRAIRSTVGVADIVRFGDQLTSVPGGVVEALQAQEDTDGFIQVTSQASFKPGDSVVVLGGPFARQLGVCNGASDKERVAVLLELLGRKVRVLLDVDTVTAA